MLLFYSTAESSRWNFRFVGTTRPLYGYCTVSSVWHYYWMSCFLLFFVPIRKARRWPSLTWAVNYISQQIQFRSSTSSPKIQDMAWIFGSEIQHNPSQDLTTFRNRRGHSLGLFDFIIIIIISAHKSDLSKPWSQTQASLSIPSLRPKNK